MRWTPARPAKAEVTGASKAVESSGATSAEAPASRPNITLNHEVPE